MSSPRGRGSARRVIETLPCGHLVITDTSPHYGRWPTEVTCISADQRKWRQIRISAVSTAFLFQHAMYLRELRHAQMERLMAEFIYGVDIYLGVARDAKFPRDPTVRQLCLGFSFKTLWACAGSVLGSTTVELESSWICPCYLVVWSCTVGNVANARYQGQPHPLHPPIPRTSPPPPPRASVSVPYCVMIPLVLTEFNNKGDPYSVLISSQVYRFVYWNTPRHWCYPGYFNALSRVPHHPPPPPPPYCIHSIHSPRASSSGAT